MKKLLATLAIVITTSASLSTAAAGATANTGTFGPAEEPTWVIPFLVAAVLIAAVVAFLGVRRGRADRSR